MRRSSIYALPDGDGFEVMRHLDAARAGVPVLVLTAETERRVTAEVQAAGAVYAPKLAKRGRDYLRQTLRAFFRTHARRPLQRGAGARHPGSVRASEAGDADVGPRWLRRYLRRARAQQEGARRPPLEDRRKAR